MGALCSWRAARRLPAQSPSMARSRLTKRSSPSRPAHPAPELARVVDLLSNRWLSGAGWLDAPPLACSRDVSEERGGPAKPGRPPKAPRLRFMRQTLNRAPSRKGLIPCCGEYR